MYWIQKLWGQSTILYSSHTYAMLHLFGHKTLIQLKGSPYYRKNSSECFFKAEIRIQALLFKVSKILMFFGKTVPENWIFKTCLLPSIFNNWFKFSFESQSHSHDTRESNMVILQYPLTVLKPVVDIQCLWI